VAAWGETEMAKSATHFEQVPIRIVERIAKLDAATAGRDGFVPKDDKLQAGKMVSKRRAQGAKR
jgi:hypothetical protein